MSSFTTDIAVWLKDGRRWCLVFPFTYHQGSKRSNRVIKVPAGFDTDFASIPKFLWFLPYWAKFSKASVLHDYLYRTQDRSRKEADLIFLEAMLVAWRKHKLGNILAQIEYQAVRIFGWAAWKGKEVMAKSDEILRELKLINVKLYGEGEFKGDIPEIKRHLENLNGHLDDHSKRITVTETLQKERNKVSKKLIGGWVSAFVAIVVALWKAFTANPPAQ